MNGMAFSCSMSIGPGPRGIIVDGGTSITALWDDGWIRRYDPTAVPIATPIFTMDAGGPLNGAAWGLVQIGSIYAATDRGRDEVWELEAPAVSGNPTINDILVADWPPMDRPRDIVLAPAGGRLYVANEGDGRLIMIDIATCPPPSPCSTTTIVSNMNCPWGLVFEVSGDLLITDECDDLIYRIIGPF